MSIDYIMIGVSDLDRSRAFYDVVFPCLGGALLVEYPGSSACYQLRNGTKAWITRPYNKQPHSPGNGGMPGFKCADRAEVDAAYAAALAHGGTDEGPPGPRPLYGPDFYGAYVRDPDGNKMSFFA
jgi:catechol 2,3-dioxygenase-like lactoylglutathione lyase family enzyme